MPATTEMYSVRFNFRLTPSSLAASSERNVENYEQRTTNQNNHGQDL